jgi:hypothetical protein
MNINRQLKEFLHREREKYYIAVRIEVEKI